MKNNTLLKPLILSVLVLTAFSLSIYLIAGNPEATLWSFLGMIIVGIFRTIQWLLALIIALTLCLAFLFAIFFGAVALFDRESSARMFKKLLDSLPDWVPSLPEACCSSSAQSSAATPVTQDQYATLQSEMNGVQERYETLHGEINGVQEHLHTTRDILSKTINQLTARIEKLEDMTADTVSQQQLNDVSHKVQNAVDSLSGIQNAVSAMQNSIDQTATQVQDISPESVLQDLPQRVQTLEEQQNNTVPPEPVDITPLQNDIKAMQNELNQVKERASKALQAATEQAVTSAAQEPAAEKPVAQEQAAQESTPEATPSSQQDQEEHRIFSYFDEEADKEKLAALVASTLDKDMSYKQILNFLAKKFGKEKGKIISSHPSLTKDYIRQCRKNHS